MTVQGGTIVVRVEGKDIGLSDLLTRINQQMAASGQSARSYATAMAQISPVAQKTDQALARYATSLAAVAKAQGDTLGSQQILAQGLQQITPATQSANAVLLQLQKSLNAEAAAAEKDAAALQALNQVKQQAIPTTPTTDPNIARTATLGRLVTAYFVATRVVKGFEDVINQGNELEKNLTTFRVLSGSQEQYAKNLQLAKEQQQQFGGSLNDTVEGMSSFANLSSRTGIEINKLTQLARAMAIIDPAQGFKGAGIALKEFFSGEITSLARRFEIPREALSGLEKITDQKAKFEALRDTLAKFGISQELIGAQANTTAVQYDKLTGNVKDATAAIGQYLAQGLLPVAKQLSDVAAEAANGFSALTTRASTLQGFAGKIFDQTSQGGIEAFNAKIRETNTAIDGNDPVMGRLIGHLKELTPAQYAYVAALTATGVSSTEAINRLNEQASALTQITGNLGVATQKYPESTAAIQQLTSALGAEASTSAEAALFAQGLSIAVAEGLPPEQAMIALQQFKAEQLRITAAAQSEATVETEKGLQATTLFTESLTANALEQANSKIQGDALKFTQEQLYNAALAAAQGMGATAQSAAALAQQFGITTQEAYTLINALSQLEVAKAKQDSGLSPRDFDTNAQFLSAAKSAQEVNKAYTDLTKVKLDNARAGATAAQRVGIEQEQLSKLQKGSVAYEEQLGRLQSAERALQAERDRNAKKNGGAPKLTPNEKINTGLLDQQDKFNNKFEDAEQKHWDKVASIYDDFNEKQQAQFAKNEVSKRRSRADFYAGLQDAPPGVDTQKFAAQYEQAFQKAQEIAQSGKAKLAAEFLDLRQKQIEEMEKLDEESAKIVQQQKEGKISKKDAQAQLDYLAGRKKLIEDAQKEEQDQLINAGDENQKRLQQQLADEEKAYSDQTDKIATQSERAANAKITHAERSKIAVSEENKVLAQQQAYYERIAKLNGGVVPANARKAPIPTTTGNAGDTAESNKPVAVEATSPIPVSSSEALLVTQAGIFIVHDDDVITTLGDLGARLEGKLGEIVSAVGDAKTAIASAVNAVESAVGRIRVTQPSAVTG